MKRTLSLLVPALLAATLSAQENGGFLERLAGKPQRVDGVAAYVNQHVLTIADVMREIPGALVNELPAGEREQKLRQIYTATLNAMVDSKLILDEAKASGAQIASWAIESRMQEILDQNFKGDPALLSERLARERKTRAEWRQELEEDMTIQYMRYHNVDRVVVVPPREIRAFYATNTTAFVETAKVDISMIVLESLDGKTLEEFGAAVTNALAKNTPFTKIAETFSTRLANEGGRLGLVNPDEDLRPELAGAVGKLKDGENTPLIIIDDVGYILRRNSSQDMRQMTLEEAWPMIENHLRQQLSADRYHAWVSMLRRKGYVKILTLPKSNN